jgi:DNA repair ATPase RecN
MTNQLTATCDNCDKITKVVFKKRYLPKSVQETYFNCQECNQHFTCFVTDKKVRDLQKKIARLKKLPYNKYPVDEVLQLQEEINNRMSNLKSDLMGNV